MKRIIEQEFLELIKHQGMTLDPRYPKSAVLNFKNIADLSRFWEIPVEARRIPYFVETILSALDPWASAYVWKHLGSWTSKEKGERLNDDVQAIIYRGIGISDDNADILEFKLNEKNQLIALIFNQLTFGWHVGDDLYIIPDNGNHIIKTDHHDVVHVSFKNELTMGKFIDEMKKKWFSIARRRTR